MALPEALVSEGEGRHLDAMLIWLIFAVVLGVPEVATVFAVASTAGVVLVRSIAPRQPHRFGVDALIGRSACCAGDTPPAR